MPAPFLFYATVVSVAIVGESYRENAGLFRNHADDGRIGRRAR